MRNIQFDIARFLCVIWIVGFWHLVEYMNSDITTCCINSVTRNITNGVLGTFMFISGFFLSKYSFRNKTDVLNFFKKRLNRFYLLFFISAVLMYTFGLIPSVGLLFTTIFGLSPFILPQPPTLWFFCMLIGFYAITPLICKCLFFLNGMKYNLLISWGG